MYIFTLPSPEVENLLPHRVKIILLYVYYLTFICKTTLLSWRTTFDHANCTLDSRNFSKGEEILFFEKEKGFSCFYEIFWVCKIFQTQIYNTIDFYRKRLTALDQMVACLPLVQQVRGSIPGVVVSFNLKIFNLEARKGEDVHFLITRLYITVLD